MTGVGFPSVILTFFSSTVTTLSFTQHPFQWVSKNYKNRKLSAPASKVVPGFHYMALHKLGASAAVVQAGSLLQSCSQVHNLKTPYFLKISSGTLSFMQFCVDTQSLSPLLHQPLKKQCCDHWCISCSRFLNKVQCVHLSTVLLSIGLFTSLATKSFSACS